MALHTQHTHFLSFALLQTTKACSDADREEDAAQVRRDGDG